MEDAVNLTFTLGGMAMCPPKPLSGSAPASPLHREGCRRFLLQKPSGWLLEERCNIFQSVSVSADFLLKDLAGRMTQIVGGQVLFTVSCCYFWDVIFPFWLAGCGGSVAML